MDHKWCKKLPKGKKKTFTFFVGQLSLYDDCIIPYHLLGSKKRKEHVECNLHTIDKYKTVLGRDKLEIHSVDKRPDLPWSLNRSKQIILNFVSNCCERVSIDKSKVCEKDSHEEWAPCNLIDEYLCCNWFTISSFNFGIKPIVEVMTRWPMIKESKSGEGNETLDV